MKRYGGLLLISVLLVMILTVPGNADGGDSPKHHIRLSGDNVLTLFQGTTGRIAIYVHVAGNEDANHVELMIHGKKKTVVGNGVFPILVTPGAGGPIMGQVLESDTVAASEPVNLGTIDMVPVPAQLVTPHRDRPDIGMPDGLDLTVSTNMYPDGENPGDVRNGYMLSLSCASLSGIKSMHTVLENRGAVNAAISAKVANAPTLRSIKTPGKRAKLPGDSIIVDFDEVDRQISYLPAGIYNLSLVIERTNGKTYGPIALLPMESKHNPDQAKTVPEKLTLSVGMRVQLSKLYTDRDSEWFDKVDTSNRKVVTANPGGEVLAKSPGTATLTFRTWDEYVYTCKVTIIPNEYKRDKPLGRIGRQVFTSTKRLCYSGSALKAEVFVFNRTGAAIRGCKGYVFRLYEDEKLIYEQPLGEMRFASALNHNKSKVYKITLTEAMVPGVAARELDLGSGRYRAVIASTLPAEAVQPLMKGMSGVVSAKSVAVDMNW